MFEKSWGIFSAAIVLALGVGCGDDGSDPPPDPPVLETCEDALAPIAHSVDPGAGPSTLGDLDTDGNRILDRDEWGPLPGSPADFDLDGTPDYEDLDDDADGLPDVYDAERLVPSVTTNLFDEDDPGPHLFGASTERDDGPPLHGVTREGATLTLEGRGLDCAVAVTFLGGTAPLAVAPLESGAEQLRVVVPVGAQGPVAIHRTGRRSGLLPLDVIAEDAPFLYNPPETSVRAGDRLRLEGESLGEVTEVSIGGRVVSVASASADAIEIVVPSTDLVDTEEVQAIASSARSNIVTVKVVRELTVTYVVPDGAASDPRFDAPTVIHDRLQEASFSGGSATVAVAAAGMDLLSLTDGPTPLLEAVVLPADSSVELSVRSSAVKASFALADVQARVAPESLGELRSRTRDLPETLALADAMAESLAGGADLAATGDYPDELAAAIDAADALVTAGLDEGWLLPFDTTLPIVDARIEPMDSGFDVSLVQSPETGDFAIRNGTAVFASIESTDLEYRRTSIPHITNPYHPAVAEPGEETAISGPSTPSHVQIVRDTHVEVLTAGSAGPGPESARAIVAHQYLVLRTVVEQILLPVIEFALDKTVEASKLVELLIKYAYRTVVNMVTQYQRSDVDGSLNSLFAFLLEEAGLLLSGEYANATFLVEVMELVFRNVPEAIADVAGRLISRITPGLGQVKVAIDIIENISSGISVVRTIGDMYSKPGRIDFDVTFGLAITDLLPPDGVERSCNAAPITVVGAGFHPRTVDGVLRFPEVVVRDLNPDGIGTVRILESDFQRPDTRHYVRGDGTQIILNLGDEDAGSMIGPLQVEVMHFEGSRDAPMRVTANAPEVLPVIAPMDLESVEPSSADPGDTVRLVGYGFDASRVIEVVFRDPMTGMVGARVSSVSVVSEEELEIVVPDLPASTTDWRVTVEQGAGGLCADTSQPQPFSVGVEGLFEIIDLSPHNDPEYRFNDINASGQLVGRVTGSDLPIIVTPMVGPTGPVWYVDDDGDMFNDLAVQLPVNGTDTSATADRINDAGEIAGTRAGGFAMVWPSPTSAPEDRWAVMFEYIQNVLFPEFGISWVMSPKPQGALAIVGNAILTGNTGRATVIDGTRGYFMGGDPTCEGCIAGRTNVGTLVFGANGSASDMNASTVCGQARDESGATRAAVWAPEGTPTFLGPEPGFCRAINASGTTAGWTLVGSPARRHATVWNGTTATDLGTLGGDTSEAIDIDDQGAVIGIADDSSGDSRPFLYLPEPRWGMAAGMHDLADLVDERLITGERAIRIDGNGYLVTNGGRLFRPR